MTDPFQAPRRVSFNRAYYRRFYQDPRTRVDGIGPLADFLFAYLEYLEIPVAKVLDLGCGIGLWRQEILRHHPSALYIGVEKSAHACKEYGWKRGSVTTYRSAKEFDLVICHDVIQYLDDTETEAAIDNLSTLARSALFLKILTAEDWESNCDQERTDCNVYLRSAAWYRKRLKRRFRACGGGVYLARSSPAVLFELEHFG